MGKESTRTLKNNTYNSKKNSKNSKKSKKTRNNVDNTTSEEMRQILDSDSEVKPNVRNFLSNNKLQSYDSDVQGPMPGMGMPGMGMQGMQGMQGMGMQGMGMQNQMMGMQNPLQMFSPSNYDPLMLQQIAPLQTSQAMAAGRPSGLLTPSAMANGMAGLARGEYTLPTGQIGGGPSMIGGGYLRRLR
jgi:hypothetical protein